MKTRLKKKKNTMLRRNANKLLSRSIAKYRHSILGIELKNGDIIGNSKCPINYIEFLYMFHHIDPYMGDRVKNAFKGALFDIYIPNKDTTIKDVPLLFIHYGNLFKSKLVLHSLETYSTDYWYTFDYISGDIKLTPLNERACRALACLDQFILRSTYDKPFNYNIWYSDKAIEKNKFELKELITSGRNEEHEENK